MHFPRGTDLLDQPHIAHIATVMADDMPHVVPTWSVSTAALPHVRRVEQSDAFINALGKILDAD